MVHEKSVVIIIANNYVELSCACYNSFFNRPGISGFTPIDF